MPLNIEQRAAYLKVLELLGGNDAVKAGLSVLQRMDKEGFEPKPPAAVAAAALSLPDDVIKGLGNLAKHIPWKCLIKCIPECAGGDWVKCAVCIAGCIAGG